MSRNESFIRLTPRNSTELDSLSFANGAIVYDSINGTLRLMDGVRQGGEKLATRTWVQNNLNTVAQPMSLTDTTQSTSTTTGALKVSGGAGIAKNLYVGNQLHVTQAAVLNSTLTLTDDLTINTNKFTVDSQTGNTLIAGTLTLTDSLALNTNKFTVNSSTGNTLVAGTLNVTNDFKVNTNKFTADAATGNTYIAGTGQVAGNFTAGNIRIDTSNVISSLNTNGNITFDPAGSGYVTISGTNALVIPVGTTAQQGPALDGAIRLNSTYGQFEGYANGNWSSLGGVRSVDGLTYIIAETSPSASDDTLHFYAGTGASTNVQVATLDKVKLALLQTTPSSSTATGALTVAGGVGIAGDLWVGGNLNLSGTELAIGGVTFNQGLTLSGSDTAATEYFTINNGSGATKFQVDTSTGALTIAGGITLNTNKFTVEAATGNTQIAGTLNTTGNFTVNTNQFSVNASTAAASFNGNVVIEGSLTTKGANYQLSGSSELAGALISLHTGTLISNDGSDIGAFYNYYTTAQESGFFGRVAADGYFSFLNNVTNIGGAFTGTYGTFKGAGFISTSDTTVGGDLAVNGGDLTSSAATFNLINTTPATINFGGNATAISIGKNTGTTTVNHALTVTSTLTASSTLTVTGELQANNASGITTTQTTFPLVNTTATTVNFAGAATAVNIGASSGTLTLNNTTLVYKGNELRFGSSSDAIIARTGAAAFRLGSTTDSATPVAQTLGVQNATGTDIAGATFTINGSRGTGSGAGGSIVFKTAPAGSTGSSQNSLSSTVTIDSTGTLTASGNVTAQSDARLKTNVETITGALDKVNALRGVLFDRISTGRREVGVIAQEVELIIPELVFTDADGIKSVAYANTVALLIEAIKELTDRVNELS